MELEGLKFLKEFFKFLKKKFLKKSTYSALGGVGPLNFNFSSKFKPIQRSFYQIYLPVFAQNMFFGTFKFEATTENRAILLISTKLVQNYSFKEKILGHFQ